MTMDKIDFQKMLEEKNSEKERVSLFINKKLIEAIRKKAKQYKTTLSSFCEVLLETSLGHFYDFEKEQKYEKIPEMEGIPTESISEEELNNQRKNYPKK